MGWEGEEPEGKETAVTALTLSGLARHDSDLASARMAL
jgi:hypothetical protein